MDSGAECVRRMWQGVGGGGIAPPCFVCDMNIVKAICSSFQSDFYYAVKLACLG